MNAVLVKGDAVGPTLYYGPGAGHTAVLGDSSIGALARGKTALWFNDADIPHDFVYVPDYVSNLVYGWEHPPWRTDRGFHELMGIPGTWQLFAAATDSAV